MTQSIGDLVSKIQQTKSEFDDNFQTIQSLLLTTLQSHEEKEEALTRRELVTNEREAELTLRETQLKKEQQKLKLEQNKVEDMNLKTKEKITVNVGGKTFETSTATLRQFPTS